MSVNTSTAYFASAGDGVTVNFGFAAPLQAPAELIVELIDTTTNLVTTQVLGVDYTVSIAGDGQSASVAMIAAPAIGKTVVRRRAADYKQPYKLPANGPFPNDMVEAALDRLVEQLQAIRDTGARGIRLADSDAPSLAALPPLATLLGKYLFINGAGMPTGVDGPAGVAVAAAWTPVIQAATLALGLSAQGFSAYVQTLIGSASQAALRLALGGVLQIVSVETGALATGTTGMPIDDTKPQNTEGDQFMQLSITPKSAISMLVIDIVFNYGMSENNIEAFALFQDSTANALAAWADWAGTASVPNQCVFRHVMTSGTTSPTIFKVRAGEATGGAGTTTFNGSAGVRLFGGVAASSITITEIG